MRTMKSCPMLPFMMLVCKGLWSVILKKRCSALTAAKGLKASFADINNKVKHGKRWPLKRGLHAYRSTRSSGGMWHAIPPTTNTCDTLCVLEVVRQDQLVFLNQSYWGPAPLSQVCLCAWRSSKCSRADMTPTMIRSVDYRCNEDAYLCVEHNTIHTPTFGLSSSLNRLICWPNLNISFSSA